MMVPPTDRPFTVIVCTGCPTGPGDPPPAAVLDELREPVRSCPQGMLVSVGCLLGEAVCTARSDLGVMAAVQPCTPDRTPVGVARILGPLRGALGAIRLRDWVAGVSAAVFALALALAFHGPGIQEVATFSVDVAGPNGTVAVSNAHGTVTGAAGGVLLRPFARLISKNGDSVTTYGEPWDMQ